MANAKPNVILVMTDDQGYGDLGCHGNPVADTPHLDQLHAESIRLTDFHAAPMCTPTRGQLLTGLDAARNGAVNVSSGRSLLRANLPTLADHFRRAGYATGLFGKWHLGDNYPYRPQDRGFDESLWFPSSHISSLPDYWLNDYFDDTYCHNGQRQRYQGYCTEVFFAQAKHWIQRQADSGKPFLAYLPTNAPHQPFYVPREDREAMEQAFAAGENQLPAIDAENRECIIRFLAMIRNLDRQVGQLRQFLAAQAMDRDTILIFMTDNGSTFGPLYYNANMRGAKCSLWEGGHRVPCFVHWPGGNLGQPRDIAGLTQVQDILPTLLDLCGLDPSSDPLDGISLAGVLRDQQDVDEDRSLPVHYSRMPYGDYPTPDSRSIMRREGAAVMWKRWRLLEATALYHLDDDPLQQHNVIEEYPEVAARMLNDLDQWWSQVEPAANQVQRITLGSDEENPMLLTACEWQDVFVDQQQQVRFGVRKNSYWHVTVDRPGWYEFALRRWPRESQLALDAPCDEAELTDGHLPAGQALPIARARVMIDRAQHTQAVQPGQEEITFRIELDAGPALLHTWFDDERNQPICGAYYVSVCRLDTD